MRSLPGETRANAQTLPSGSRSPPDKPDPAVLPSGVAKHPRGAPQPSVDERFP